MTTIYSIGHGNHTLDEFVSMLQSHEIETLADIRTYPGSHHCPWFNSETLPAYLMKNGIGYVHIKKLGGRRPKQWNIDPTINSGWDVQHIFADNHVEKHKMGVWGAPVHVEDGIVTYPSDKPVQLMLMI